jgi:hypothetical protein
MFLDGAATPDRGSGQMSIARGAAISCLCAIGFIVFAYVGSLWYVDARLRDRSLADVYQSGGKIWATRGLVSEGVERNSIASVRNAFARGAPGTEVDIFYDTALKQFVVSHGRNYRVKKRKLLSLEHLFEETGQGTQLFWLDFKGLRHLSSTDLEEAVSRLDVITREHGLRSRVYVEGGAPLSLAAFQRAGFHTIFDIYPLRSRFPFWSLVINSYKIAYYFGGFSVVSMKYGDQSDPVYSAEIAAALAEVPVFLYHVPEDEDVLSALLASSSVRVILINQESTRFETEVRSRAGLPTDALGAPSRPLGTGRIVRSG